MMVPGWDGGSAQPNAASRTAAARQWRNMRHLARRLETAATVRHGYGAALRKIGGVQIWAARAARPESAFGSALGAAQQLPQPVGAERDLEQLDALAGQVERVLDRLGEQ